MLSRRDVVAGLAAVGLMHANAFAAESSAKDFLNGIYAKYKGKNAKGVSLKTDADYARYFTPSLAALILQDAKEAEKKGDIPSLEGDPFIDAQDFQIAAYTIAVKDLAPDKAHGTVKFKNMKDNVTAEIDLVKTKDGWRIDEIVTGTGSLRGLFKKQ